MGCGPIYCLATFRGLAGLCFWAHKIKVETTHEKNLLQLLFLPSSPGTTAQIIYILNLDIEERTFGVLEIKAQIVFHNHLFLVLSMLSLLSYSVLFLLLLFPLLFILAFLLLFLLLSLLLTFVCILFCFLLCLPIVILFLATALLLLRFLMFLSILLSPPLILLISDLGL